MTILATNLSGILLLMNVLLLIQTKMPLGWFVLFPKLTAGALSPYWAIIGVVGAIIGGISGAYWAVPIGIISAGIMTLYVWRCARDHTGFEDAFGTGWEGQIPPQQAKRMVKRRCSWFLKMKASPDPIWERDVSFWIIPDTKRKLLCDIWRPADCNVSGLAMVFFHGSGWYLLDKDMGTRPFFRHLTAQGHTVMDVPYRLCPEVDIYGMIGDVKRAIAWMKANASRYRVNPEKIVLGGSSVGGHLVHLTGYAPQHPDLTSDDPKKVDLSVCGIVSSFGPSDLLVEYEHSQVKQRSENRLPYPIGTKLEANQEFLFSGRLDMILGGYLKDIPETHQLFSPITHVHPDCPPTLLNQGNKDMLVPLDITIALYQKLVESGVPAINVVVSGGEHCFDLLLPQISPPAQSALYDVDRFWAILANK
ncbi:MAG TPA: alpha/beta hydrolase [Anaerolineales bacterium]